VFQAGWLAFHRSVCDLNTLFNRAQATIVNLREKIARLAVAMEELAKHGPMKPEELRGLDNVEVLLLGVTCRF
jgi:hypothetical protein